jgi:hypothetical protein
MPAWVCKFSVAFSFGIPIPKCAKTSEYYLFTEFKLIARPDQPEVVLLETSL